MCIASLNVFTAKIFCRNFGFKKKKKFTISVAKTKVLISFAVTAKLICFFVFRICRLLVFS